MATLKKKPQPKKAAAAKPAKPADTTDLDGMIDTLADMRDRSKTLTAEIKEQQEAVLSEMDRLGLDKYDHRRGDKTVKATKVQSESLIINEDKLMKRIGNKMWNRISTRRLDKAKLDAFVASGEVKQSDVAAASEFKKSNPFIKVT